MKVRTQLITGMVFFVGLIVFIAALTIGTNIEVEQINEQEQVANAIALEVGELGYLSNDYILYRETQQIDRWNSKYASISGNIDRLSVNSPEQQELVRDLRYNLNNTRSVFNDITSSPVQPGEEDTHFIQLSWSRMAVQNQGMIFDAGRLANLLRAQADTMRQARTMLIFAFSGAFLAFLLTSYFLFYRRTLRSIADLQEGAKIIGSGNLDHTLKEKGDDEISDLSRSFNRMTSDLKQVTASKSELEWEIGARIKAEEELSRKNEELTAMNEELTGAQAELLNLAQQRQLALDAARMGWWRYDSITGILSWDDRYGEIFEVTGHQGQNDSILETRLHPDDLPGVREKTRSAMESVYPRFFSADYRIMLPDGSIRWIEAHGIGVSEGAGTDRRPAGLVGTVTDITERRQAEISLQTTLERLRALVSNMRVGILMIGDDRVELVNRTFCDYFRLKESPEELIGLSAREIIGKIRDIYLHPEDELNRISEIISRGVAVTGEEIAMRDGRLFLRDYIPIAMEGVPYGRLWYHVDITDRKALEDRMVLTAEKYTTLFDTTSDGIWIQTLDGIVLEVNDAYCAMSGYTRYELIGMRIARLEAAESPEDVTGHIRHILESGGHDRFESKHQRKDGTLFDVEITAIYLPREERMCIFARDITERKRAEEKLRLYAEHLSQSNKELEQFAYVASHDLREPLRMVTIYAQLLEKNYRGRLDTDADEFIHYIVDGGTRMASLVDDLLEYSRVTSKARPFELTDMNRVVADALKNLSAALNESGGEVHVGQLPGVMADRSQMTQVFQNLIGNAIKFRGGKVPVIDVGGKYEDGWYLYYVKDNGIGIDPAYFGKIFDIFQRLHTREEYEGTGIGLAICRRIIERHGGRIWVESRIGEGSIFFFTIPASRPERDSPVSCDNGTI